MKNVLFIHAHEKEKALFFSSVSKFLNKKNINTYHLAFRRLELEAYRICGISNLVFMPKELKKFSCELNSNIHMKYDLDELLFYNYKLNDINSYKYDKEALKKNVNRYINFLYDFKEKNSIDYIIMWNNTFAFDSIAKKFTENEDLSLTMFEAGIFRPNTITIDSKGINYGNSVPNKKEYYSQIANRKIKFPIIQQDASEYFSISTPRMKSLFIKERIIDKFHTDIIKDELKLEVIFEDFFQKTKKNLTKKYLDVSKKIENDNIALPEKFVFVPFQVHDDSQIILNSKNIDNMEQLVEEVTKAVDSINRNLNEKLSVVFKEHPANLGRVHYSNLYNKFKDYDHITFLKKGNTTDILKKSSFVITINSTVGIEALQMHKPVITLGDAYYNIEGIVLHCNELKELRNYIIEALEYEVNVELVDRFLSYLRYYYQLEGDWRKGIFNSKQLQNKMNLIYDETKNFMK